jgi:hypothetical protein
MVNSETESKEDDNSPYSVNHQPRDMDKDLFDSIVGIDDNSSIQLIGADALDKKTTAALRAICNV